MKKVINTSIFVNILVHLQFSLNVSLAKYIVILEKESITITYNVHYLYEYAIKQIYTYIAESNLCMYICTYICIWL